MQDLFKIFERYPPEHSSCWDLKTKHNFIEINGGYMRVEDGTKFWNIELYSYIPQLVFDVCQNLDFDSFEFLFKNFRSGGYIHNNDVFKVISKCKDVQFADKVLSLMLPRKMNSPYEAIKFCCSTDDPKLIDVFLKYVEMNKYIIYQIMSNALINHNLNMLVHMLENWNILKYGGNVNVECKVLLENAVSYKYYDIVKILELYFPQMDTKYLKEKTEYTSVCLPADIISVHNNIKSD